jgi:hypothetical protein
MKTPIVLLIVLVVVASVAWADQSPSTQPSKPDAKTQAAFENYKKLAGQWRGKSTKGWDELLDIKIIAGGTCVLETSEFAHGKDPQNAMATVYHLDGTNLMLTHYCMAKNQPRLRATQIDETGKNIIFEFLDGTGMASRDVGHMDKVKVRFVDDDHFKSQWTFYAKGKEQWMEEVTYERVTGPATQPSEGGAR